MKYNTQNEIWKVWNDVGMFPFLKRHHTYFTGINTIPMERKCKKGKWLSGEVFASQDSCEKKRSKQQRRKGKI